MNGRSVGLSCFSSMMHGNYEADSVYDESSSSIAMMDWTFMGILMQ